MNQPNELYGSHLPILSRVVDLTHGPILELGMGLYSTPYLHTVSFLQKRLLVSYDNDSKWFFKNKEWESKYHKVVFVTDWEYADIDNTHWSVVFVDHKPAKQRIKEVRRLAWKANYILIHDSEAVSDKYFKYKWIYSLFKYRYDYSKLIPNTTVLSNFCDLSNL